MQPSAPLPDGVGQATIGVRGGLLRWPGGRPLRRAVPEPGYAYESAEQAGEGYRRDRPVRLPWSGNPTVAMFEERLADGGRPGGLRHRPGMSAVFIAPVRFRCRRPVGGGPQPVRSVPSWCATRFCRGGAWRRCSSTVRTSRSGSRRSACPPRRWFFETPSNPMQTLVDIAAVSDGARCRREGGAGQRLRHRCCSGALLLGVDVVIHPALGTSTGRAALGGAILGDKGFIDGPVQTLMRHTDRR